MLSRAAVQRNAPKVRAQMGKAGEALEKLVGLLDGEGRANLAAVLESLYPDVDETRALANLRQLRLEIEKAASKAGVSFELAGDKKTRTEARKRVIWFDGEDSLSESTEEWVRPNIELAEPRMPQTAVKLGPVRLYVVYSEEDKADAGKLLEVTRARILRSLRLRWWITTACCRARA